MAACSGVTVEQRKGSCHCDLRTAVTSEEGDALGPGVPQTAVLMMSDCYGNYEAEAITAKVDRPQTCG